jgi:hypothetical protein
VKDNSKVLKKKKKQQTHRDKKQMQTTQKKITPEEKNPTIEHESVNNKMHLKFCFLFCVQ